jgi:hypothetical protein
MAFKDLLSSVGDGEDSVNRHANHLDTRCAMNVGKVSEIVAIMLAPTVAVGAALYLPRGIRAVRRALRERAAAANPRPSQPPIEDVAADLRRLLLRHEAVKHTTDVAMRAQHLRALEGAITDCAFEAARSLDLPCPARPARGALATPDLRRLLRALADAGLVLPPAVGLLADDRRI